MGAYASVESAELAAARERLSAAQLAAVEAAFADGRESLDEAAFAVWHAADSCVHARLTLPRRRLSDLGAR